jgi:hypothetical protein
VVALDAGLFMTTPVELRLTTFGIPKAQGAADLEVR